MGQRDNLAGPFYNRRPSMEYIDLSEIEALAEDMDPGSKCLSPTTIDIALAAMLAYRQQWRWIDDGEAISTARWDLAEELLSKAMDELMDDSLGTC